MQNEQIQALVFEAIEQVNRALPPEKRLSADPSTPISGPGATLDSMGQVNLVVEIEDRIHDTFGAEITLADQAAMARQPSPFETVQSLIDYIEEQLEQETAA